VAYAKARYITIIPEIDSPSHTNAALASYAKLNCDGKAPPLYTGINVGFSSLCVDKPVTYRFWDDVVREIAALTPGPYFHMGGDEAHSTSHSDYVTFVNRAARIVSENDKKVYGWQEVAAAHLPRGSRVQYWGTGDRSSADLARQAVRQGAQVVMSPANRIYLDQKYNPDTELGLHWAGYVTVHDSYAWDPATQVSGVNEAHIAGVEAALWSETLKTLPDIEYMAFPRMAGAAEIGWSPASTHDWDVYKKRLAAQGPRWNVLDINYYHAPDVPWPTS
jgi:hexosaminidase